MRKSVFVAALFVASLVATSALAQEDNPFGKQGQLAISSDASLSLLHTSRTNGGGDNTDLRVAPAVDYFIVDSVSLGGQVLFDSNSGDNSSSTTFGIGPRVGYNLNITHNIGFWPRAYVLYDHTSTSNNNKDGPSFSTFTVGVFAPLLFHPAEHFFLGLGPRIQTDLSNSASFNGQSADGPKATVLGLDFTLGGYFNL